MKLNPDYLPRVNWRNKKELKRYLGFITLNLKGKEKFYKCVLCNSKFKTNLGAYKHLKRKHAYEVIKTELNKMSTAEKKHIAKKAWGLWDR